MSQHLGVVQEELMADQSERQVNSERLPERIQGGALVDLRSLDTHLYGEHVDQLQAEDPSSLVIRQQQPQQPIQVSREQSLLQVF